MHRTADDVPTRVFDWGTIKWLVTPHLDDGAGLTTGEVIVYPSEGHAPHRHPGEEEVIYVISGRGIQTVGEGDDEERFPIAEGDVVYIPTNVLHSTYNTTWSPLRLVVVYTPGGAETVLDSLPGARVLDSGAMPHWSQSA
ncbi:MAG TPA: cupin domain-containing protein [Acidimicrobiales bacterium]|nr:cupin domain-containing protein [Acidimicrobiales bacterium]